MKHVTSSQDNDASPHLTPVGMSDLTGVWKRTLLVSPKGVRDECSEVYWLQSSSICADLRIEANGPPTAFAGKLIHYGDIFRWERFMTSYEVSGFPDEGYLRWQDGHLREDGVHEPYSEIWKRIAVTNANDLAIELVNLETGQQGYYVAVGNCQFLAYYTEPQKPTEHQKDTHITSRFLFCSAGPHPKAVCVSNGVIHHLVNTQLQLMETHSSLRSAFTPSPDQKITISEVNAQGGQTTTHWSVVSIEYPNITTLFRSSRTSLEGSSHDNF